MRISIAILVAVWCIADVPITAAPDNVRAEARQLYARLIAFKTSKGFGQVPIMASYLAAELRSAGFPEEDVHILPLDETASFVVTYRGDGTGGRPIVLLAHMDVVTADPTDWQRDPFTLVEENGYFFGRGTLDIKADVVAITMTFLRLKREGFVPTRDLILVFTGDEETDQATTRDLVENHRALIDAEFALNGDGGGGVLAEGTGKASLYSLQGAEKTYASFEITARNAGGHSAEPRVENAIYDLASALKALQAYRFPVRWNEWTLASLAASGAVTPGALGTAMTRFAANPNDAEAAEVLAAAPTHVGQTRTTCVATMLSGGHAENALPQKATATVNCRIFPGTSVSEVEADLRRVVGDKVSIGLAGQRAAESVASPMRADVVNAVTRAVHASYPGVRIVPDQASYYTDGALFRAAGIPTYGASSVFLKDSDSFAHGLNERVPVSAFYNGLTHWDELIRNLAARHTDSRAKP